MIQTDNDNAMDASLFKSGTQTQKDLDDLVWTQTQETSELDIDKIKIQVSKIRSDQKSDFFGNSTKHLLNHLLSSGHISVVLKK